MNWKNKRILLIIPFYKKWFLILPGNIFFLAFTYFGQIIGSVTKQPEYKVILDKMNNFLNSFKSLV